MGALKIMYFVSSVLMVFMSVLLKVLMISLLIGTTTRIDLAINELRLPDLLK